MTIPVLREQIDAGADDGSRLHGNAREVIQGWTTGRILKKGESGALVVFSTAAGQALVLPAVAARDVGMFFDAVFTVSGTGTYSITTDAATTFIIGSVGSMSTTIAEGGGSFAANGTSHTNFTADTDATGRLVGTILRFTALSSTLWAIDGVMMGAGTITTPF